MSVNAETSAHFNPASSKRLRVAAATCSVPRLLVERLDRAERIGPVVAIDDGRLLEHEGQRRLIERVADTWSLEYLLRPKEI